MDDVVFQGGAIWCMERAGVRLAGRGDPQWLAAGLMAFFASRECPGAAIRAALDWALQRARGHQPVIGGFHSPLERSVLKLLLEAYSPAVVVLARSVRLARLPAEWNSAIGRGHLTIVSAADDCHQLSRQRAAARNALVVRLAGRIVIAHASEGGRLASQVGEWQSRGKRTESLCG